MVPHGYGLKASVSVTQRSPKSPAIAVEVARRRVGEAVEQAVRALEHGARSAEARACQQRRAHAGLRRPAGMHALGPGAFRQIFDDAARHRAGDAERIDGLLAAVSRSAAATPAAAPMAPKIAVGWKPALWVRIGATRLSRHITSTPTAMPSSAVAAVRMVPLARGEHRRHDDRAGMHRPALERVVEVLAMRRRAVDERRAGGAQGSGMADRRARAVVVPAGERGADVVLVARGEAKPHDVDSQILALLLQRRRQPRRIERGDALGEDSRQRRSAGSAELMRCAGGSRRSRGCG